MKDVGCFGLRISGKRSIGVLLGDCQMWWKLPGRLFFRRHLVAGEIVVMKADGRQTIAKTRDVDDASKPAAGRSFCSFDQKWRQKGGEQKVTDMIGAEGLFKAVGSLSTFRGDNTGIVDEDVEVIAKLRDLCGSTSDSFE